MPRRQREPLSDEEIDFLVQLANGNALAHHRRRERERRRSSQSPRPEKRE
ncbi:MAG: hypothetical protein ABN479_09455 [Billgrantia sp.]|jgi:GAF domain-containing protein|uniref:Uncharacterized protein n=1 Tax=Billgrantia desiderata TaxID=52021 RepID=A0ABS9B9T2_9GAMM|nr:MULTISPECIES: hypothetical protein [Halomonas]MCE8010069.1 hypothetical protein [Halomonas desiderata]MCE8040448.1 hypothetical protein [Halomonas sp. MCCC 1A11062]MCE8043798.1 hypothetical protein [Halomonas desiderata]MCE8048479.1 hypothetical protein [Halomonas desiderata]SEF94177.1 hypothetical protein SAMN04487953_10929 [Halomonas desiderata]